MRFIIPLALAACMVSGQLDRDSGLRVATWNVQNYLVQNRFEDGRFLYRYPMPESRKKRIREAILAEKPHILFLQEIGGSGFLLELQLDLRAAGLDYPFSVFSGLPDARSGLACLSMLPPAEAFHYPLSLRRGIQELVFLVGPSRLRFFHVHLKSRYSDDPADPQSISFRTGEIAVLSDFLQRFLDADHSSAFFLLGDFNTPFHDPLLHPLRSSWVPVAATDPTGDPNTYFHHSGSAEIIDGFWIAPTGTHFPHAASIRYLPDDTPSDHRFLILHLPSLSY